MITPPPIQKIPKKTKTFMEKTTDVVSTFLGSWWAVIFHTFWFTIWLVYNFDINLLTFSVSLEAIFIGIFLLMASNKAEISRDKRHEKERKKDRQRLEKDIKLDQKADRQLLEIKRTQRILTQKLDQIQKTLKQLQA